MLTPTSHIQSEAREVVEAAREGLRVFLEEHVDPLQTEPDVGSDPARLGTTATPTADGTG